MNGIVSKDTFKGYSTDSKLDTLYDLQVMTISTIDKRINNHDKRIIKIERRKRFDTSVAAGSGILGGFVAMILKLVFWK